ncbi:esterase-like activity of phytase family protein [Paracoccus sp. (in: a-proteobacteria)]|uniref:esterase-like activity of phytase family protein n=1 Tax=Paracoccus sp. TaxID=267 RepID=UPI0026E0F3EB|nr:esterase-like activity of phytase family protein [Paracoccus sp. (in: a-proteobacteria)]
MPIRRSLALILAAFGLMAAPPAGAVSVDYIATYVWSENDPDFGGYSAVEISEDGDQITALSDRGTLRWGRIERDTAGRIRGVETLGQTRLRDSKGQPLKPGWQGDSEGLAIAPDGTLWVSFEGLNRIAGYITPASPARRIPSPPAFADLIPNASLESLAMEPNGCLLTMPEDSGSRDTAFPIWRWCDDGEDGAWDQPWSIPRDGDWLVAGSDFGPDGRFYILERRFLGIRGFSSRVRRFDFGPKGPGQPETVLETRPLHYDNLEGISVWQDDLGIRLTMISDDNFLFIQRTEIVEYRIRD